MEWKRRGDDSIPAMSNLDDLLSAERLASIESGLRELCQPFFETSIVVVRDVKRIPLKIVDANDELEQDHLESSCDGLRFFRPVDIYSDNVVHAQGLLAVTRTLQQLEGFGSITHRRFGQYSLLHVDVKIFWQLLRILYSYPGLVGMRHDLFLVFGFWHAYQYAHIALWNEFRHTFLAPAFFTLFPVEKLMQRPRLSQSSTFFTWLRMSYPSFRDALRTARRTVKQRVLSWQREYVQAVRQGQEVEKINPHLAMYIHINLHTLSSSAFHVFRIIEVH